MYEKELKAYEDYLIRKRFRPETIKSYLGTIRQFLKHLDKIPKSITQKDIGKFETYCTKYQNNSLTNPAAVGVRVQSKLELGLIYDIAITVIETVRGNEAIELLKAADSGNKEPSEGFEYILARIKFEINERAASNNRRSFMLGDNPLQWVAISNDLIEYPQANVKVPEPGLAGIVQS